MEIELKENIQLNINNNINNNIDNIDDNIIENIIDINQIECNNNLDNLNNNDNIDILKFKTTNEYEYNITKSDSPLFGRIIHPAYNQASFGNSVESSTPEEEELKKKMIDIKLIKKISKQIFLPLLFSSIIALIFILMYYLDWKNNYPNKYSAKTTIFLVVFVVIMFILLLEIWHAGVVLMTSIAFLLYCNVITTSQTFEGFSDSGTMTVLSVCIISDAINLTGGLTLICNYILPNTKQKWIWPTTIRIVPLFMLSSIFLNNTPIVAMGISIILGLSKTTKIPSSKLLMSMQIAVCLGGMCSLIGTSPNMVAKGLLDDAIKKYNTQTKVIDYTLGLFEVGYVAGPIAVIGCIYLIFSNDYLLPSNEKKEKKQLSHTFIIPIVIVDRSPLIGKEIINTDLGKLSGCSISDIIRNNEIISSSSLLEYGDILIYICEPDLIYDLLNIKGIKFEDPVTCNILSSTPSEELNLFEVSITENSVFNNKCFPSNFEGNKFGIIGISNDNNNYNLIKQQPLYFSPTSSNSSYLIITHKNYLSSELYPLPFRIAYKLPIQLPFTYPLWKSLISISCLIIPIILDVLGIYKIVQFSFLSVAILILSKVMTINQVYSSINVPLITTLGASFGLSSAMSNTNTGYLIAMTLVKLLSPLGKIGILFGIVTPTILLTQVLSNNATIAVMFPIVWNIYLGSDPYGNTCGKEIGLRSSVIAMMIASSSCFFLPFGYQTNLMVMKDGGYKVKNFMIYGAALEVLYLLGSVLLSYLIFELSLDPILPTNVIV